LKLVLASASPRRRELLALLGVPFEVVTPEVEERTEGDPLELVLANAELKARAGAALAAPDARVVGSDTDVALDGRVLGKPADREAAAERLRALSGRSHRVHSGVFLVGEGAELRGAETTLVRFRELSDRDIDRYLDTGEWQGRAGGYAVQGFGSSLITGIEGDLSNVIGLPLPLVSSLLEQLQQH
jgi:septum formation protein